MYLFVWVYGRENIQYSAQKKEGSIKLGNKSPHVQGTAVADYSTGLTWKMHISVNNRSYEHQYKCRLPPTKDKRIHQRTIPLPRDFTKAIVRLVAILQRKVLEWMQYSFTLLFLGVHFLPFLRFSTLITNFVMLMQFMKGCFANKLDFVTEFGHMKKLIQNDAHIYKLYSKHL